MAPTERVRLACLDAGALGAFELDAGDAPDLQRFFDDNPGYFLAVQGEPAGPAQALEEIQGLPPPDWPFTKRWLIGYADAEGRLAAFANVISDLLAPGVWHIGLFIVATPLQGQGLGKALMDALEARARAGGARWLRLGVVASNVAAERFWKSRGFVAVRQRGGYIIGRRTNVVWTMVKPLAAGTLPEYLGMVERDRPDPPGA